MSKNQNNTNNSENTVEITEELLKQVAINATPLRPDDRAMVKKQLGREPRGLIAIGARCACGRPAVTITSPRLPDGSPFPTFFYLCLPELIVEVSRLEVKNVMKAMSKELAEDEEARAAHQKAHESYCARRALLGDVPEIANISAGGMPTHVKCLHALVGYALAAGEGVCPVADKALAMMNWDTSVCHCGKKEEGEEGNKKEGNKKKGNKKGGNKKEGKKDKEEEKKDEVDNKKEEKEENKNEEEKKDEVDNKKNEDEEIKNEKEKKDEVDNKKNEDEEKKKEEEEKKE